MAIERPNQMWCADLTYLPMAQGFLYLVAILDVAWIEVLKAAGIRISMDGLTMAEKLHRDFHNSTVSIVMLTPADSPTMNARGKAAGLKDWIVKPFKGDAVLPSFRKLIEG